MKKILTTVLLLPGAALADSAADYVNFIRQVQQDTGVEWDVTVAAKGSQLSPTGVSEDGAFFELWAIHNTSLLEYLLDEQYVTSYTPNAHVKIITADPYQPVARTRCDQPFQVQVTVTGLVDSSDPTYSTAPVAAKMVDYSHSVFNYPEGAHSLEGVESPVGTLVVEGVMDGNATATVTFPVTNLGGSDLTAVEGEEVFTVSALEDYGVSATILDSERVQIWPIATGTLSGYDPDMYYEDVPSITVTLQNLYPSSSTYVRLYPGTPTSNPENPTMVSASYVVIQDSIPRDRSLVLKDIDRYFVEEGVHTLEILHETPFGIDLLHSGTIRVDRTVRIKGNVYARGE